MALPAGGSWQTVTAAPASSLSNPLLLTDGTVLVHAAGSRTWYRLTPNSSGSYINGTWSQIASLPSGYTPQYFASAVLPDGRVVINGGEYNGGATPTETNLGAIYDPIANTWTSVSPPSGGAGGWSEIGDAQSVVLANGTYMLASCCANPPVDALFNASSLTWSSTGVPSDYQNEQGYTLLPDGRVLTINVWNSACYPNCNAQAAQAYNSATSSWSAVASPPVPLVDPYQCGNYEIGPAILRPDGTVVAFGGNTGCVVGNPANPTAVYNTSNNSWVQGPNVPSISGSYYNLADAPAVLLPNGNILFAASPGFGSSPTHFFEFTSANAINQVNDTVFNASSSGAYYYNFLVLPNGQILATDFSNQVEIYTPTGSANAAWAPTIASVPNNLAPAQTYQVSGTQLNGLSQGAAYGDDAQSSTNYPLVRITNNNTGHVFYARTFNHSTMSVAPNASGSTNFVVPAGIETGASSLVVVANGIASQPVAVTISSSPALDVTPATNIAAAGNQGGPFSPASFQYQLRASTGTVGYAISGKPTWLDVSSASGTVTTSGKTITFTVNTSANSLSGGTYNATITFTDTTNSATALTVAATLTVTPTTTLVVSPATNMSSAGPHGGPFSPSSFQYQISATTGTINYSISGLPAWLSPSSTSGSLTTSPLTITFTVNSNANSLTPNTYNAAIAFTNTTNGDGNQSRNAQLVVGSGGGGASVSNAYVSARSGTDAGSCAVTAPCATLNYALSVLGAGGQVNLLDGGVFGPIVINQAVTIVGTGAEQAQIVASAGAQVGCIGAPAGSCGFSNNGYGIEIASGASDVVKITNVTVTAGDGVGALKLTTGGQIEITRSTFRGNDTATGPIVSLSPNGGAITTQVYFSYSDIGFNNAGSNAAGAITAKPVGTTSLKMHFNHAELHNAAYGVLVDGTQLSSASSLVSAFVSESEFFALTNAAIGATSTSGTGTVNATANNAEILNAGIGVSANGPQTTVVVTNGTMSGSAIGVQTSNGAVAYTAQNNTLKGNGTDISGTLTAAPRR